VRFRRAARRKVAIDIAPLVDVVFLLVIFFAVSTTFEDKAGMKLELPTSSSTVERETSEVTLQMAEDGRLVLEGEPVTEETLEDALQAVLKGSSSRLVVLRADREVRHGEVVRIMGLIRKAGAEGLTIAAKSGGE